MKKLINLIALVMLVSTNVLTPFSYAGVETPEVIPENEMENVVEVGETPEINEEIPEINEETPELVPEEKGELEQENQEDVAPENVLPNVQDDVESPTTDETEKIDTESDEVVQPVEEISENEIQDEEGKIEELEKVEESVVMDIIPGTIVTLLPGTGFNSVIKTLANGGTYVAYTGVDNNIQSFQRVDVEIAGVTTGEISIAGAEYPVHAWFSGGILYYTTQAEIIQLNEDSQLMFQGFSGLTGLDLSNFDTSDVTSMSNIFNGCSKLEDLNLSGWDFTKVTDMSPYGPIQSASQAKKLNMENTKFSGSMNGVFSTLANLEEINLSGADVSRVTNMSYVFNGCRNLKEINLQGWDTSNVTTMNSMFYYCNSLKELDLSSFDTNRVTDMTYLVGVCSSLEKLNLDNWSFYGNPTISNMFYGTSSLKTLSAKNRIIPENFTQVLGCNGTQLCANDLVIDVSNWNLSKAKNLGGLFKSFYGKEVKGLYTWDTSGVENMGSMFDNCGNLNGLNLSGRDTSGVTNMQYMFHGCSSLTGLDLSSFDTSNVVNMQKIFNGCNKLEELNLSGWDFRNITDMSSKSYGPFSARSLKKINLMNAKFSGSVFGIFNDLQELEEVNLSGADVTRVTNMAHMFNGCRNLKEINLQGWDTSNVTTMNSMFYYCNSLKELDLSSFDTNRVTDMTYLVGVCSSLEKLNLDNWSFYGNPTVSSMFYDNSSLRTLSAKNWKIPENFSEKLGCGSTNLCSNSLDIIDVTNWDLSRTKNLYGLFKNSKVKNIKGLDTWDTSNVTNMYEMFYGCNNLENLDLNGWNLSGNTSIGGMFGGMTSLKNLSLKNWTIPENFTNAIGCRTSQLCATGLESIDVTDWDLSGTKNLNGLFGNLYAKEIKGLDTWDTSGIENMGQMFQYCYNLTGLDLSNWKISKVTNMENMFSNCRNLNMLSLSGWDFSNYDMNGFAPKVLGSSVQGGSKIRVLDMTNTIFSGNMARIFEGLFNTEEIILKGADTSNVMNMAQAFIACSKLTGLDLSSFDTSKVTNMGQMFYGCSSLTGLDLSNFDTSNVINMGFGNGGIFGGCNKLEELNLSGWDFKNVSNASLMMNMTAGGIPSLTKLNMTNTKYTGNATYAFGGLNKLEYLNLNGADTSNVIDMKEMFQGCSNLTELDLSSFDTSNVTSMGNMFKDCSKIEELNLNGWDFSSNPSIGNMFGGASNLKKVSMRNWTIPETFTHAIGCRTSSLCSTSLESIDVSNWDLSKTKDLNGLFGSSYAKEIKGLDTWDTSGVTNMSQMFYGCSNLTGLDLGNRNTENVTNMNDMFNGCSNLISLDLSNWDTSNVTGMNTMFVSCTGLEKLNLNNWDLSNNPSMGGLIVNTPSLKYISMRGWKIPQSFTNVIGRVWGHPNDSIEEIDVSGWDLSLTTDINGLFGDMEALKEIKGLDTWDTSNVINMSNMFFNCSNLTGLNLSSWNTENVVLIYQMFAGCSNLEKLDLSNRSTAKLGSFGQIVGGCNKLEELNMSGWDFRKFSVGSLLSLQLGLGEGGPLKTLDMTNAKFSGSMFYSFGGQWNLEELKLNGVDTSGVTDMTQMFYHDSKLKNIKLGTFDTSNVMSMGHMFSECKEIAGLDLSNFDTSKVTDMEYMFYKTSNLKTIYASDKFVTENVAEHGYMFDSDINLVGGNGTKFDSNYIDKTYALIDKQGQTGYFTDKNAINVKFINTLDGTETTSTFAKGQKLTPPYVDKYHVVGGYLDEAMTQPIDLKKGVDAYSVIYVKYERNGSSGGGGGGGGGSTKPDTPEDEQQPAEPSQTDASSGTNVKEPETNTGSNIQTGSQVDPSEQTTQNNESNTQDSSTSSQNDEKIYSTEFQEAYEFAKGNGITTMPTIQKANMEGKLTRIAMAKMLSQYAINVLGQTPDTSKTIKFKDVSNKKDADYDNGVTLAYQLGIMGQNMPGNKFRPNDEVSRAEFATALSRLLYQTTDGKYKSTKEYYIPHMAKLYNEGIISNTDPSMSERRGYVMIMLMRSAE